jgi:Ax21 family sulfation-dependent quorum factor
VRWVRAGGVRRPPGRRADAWLDGISGAGPAKNAPRTAYAAAKTVTALSEHCAKVPVLTSSVLRIRYALVSRMRFTDRGSAPSPLSHRHVRLSPQDKIKRLPMKRSLLALTLLAALPFAASAAEGVSYSYVQGGYAATNNNDGVPDADGFGIEGSVAVHPNFHLFGAYGNQEIDDTDLDFDQWRVGAGYNRELTGNLDLLTRVAYEKVDFGGGLDADGYSAEVGVRGAAGKHFEGYALAGYQKFESVDGDFYGRLGTNVKFNENWAINGDVKFADGDAQWFVGPRFSW